MSEDLTDGQMIAGLKSWRPPNTPPPPAPAMGGDFYKGIEWLACWLLDNVEGETITEEQLRPWAVKAWQEHKDKPAPATGDDKIVALERLVIELTMIAIGTATIKHHHKARLDELLGELQYAGMDDKSLDAELVKTKIQMIDLEGKKPPTPSPLEKK